ncbi:hypothetical protein C2G38_835518 [Gigaspora rosea]|uniref:Uncharacterized protein n=1 Tax=Gigaspora rosea TaxID=44941 RepID=A0A397U279_9GLOM|nr:hypothetical protein C2G38_835518 [Gigaspora rosea]
MRVYLDFAERLFFLKLCPFVFLAALFLNYKRRSLMFVTFIRCKFLQYIHVIHLKIFLTMIMKGSL